jgi:RNA polymerase sigma factor (sigma-70 family)
MNYVFDELINDKEIQNIGYKAALKFKRQLDKEEIDSCFMTALWKACKAYDPNYNAPEKMASFKTFFYKGVLFECMKLTKSNNAFKENINKIKNSKNINKIRGFYEESSLKDTENQDFGLNQKDSDVLIQRFWQGKSLKELANQNNISQQAMKKRINKILNKIKISGV